MCRYCAAGGWLAGPAARPLDADYGRPIYTNSAYLCYQCLSVSGHIHIEYERIGIYTYLSRSERSEQLGAQDANSGLNTSMNFILCEGDEMKGFLEIGRLKVDSNVHPSLLLRLVLCTIHHPFIQSTFPPFVITYPLY